MCIISANLGCCVVDICVEQVKVIEVLRQMLWIVCDIVATLKSGCFLDGVLLIELGQKAERA